MIEKAANKPYALYNDYSKIIQWHMEKASDLLLKKLKKKKLSRGHVWIGLKVLKETFHKFSSVFIVKSRN